MEFSSTHRGIKDLSKRQPTNEINNQWRQTTNEIKDVYVKVRWNCLPRALEAGQVVEVALDRLRARRWALGKPQPLHRSACGHTHRSLCAGTHWSDVLRRRQRGDSVRRSRDGEKLFRAFSVGGSGLTNVLRPCWGGQVIGRCREIPGEWLRMLIWALLSKSLPANKEIHVYWHPSTS